MAFKIEGPFWQTLGVGTLAGLRTFSAPAITSHILSHHHSKNLEGSALKFMQNNNTAAALKVLAVTELLADKLPSAGNRIRPAGLVVRTIAGAVAGASIYKAAGGNAVKGGVIGGAASIASTFVSFFVRKQTVKHTNIIDPVIGMLEDALVFGAGAALTTTA